MANGWPFGVDSLDVTGEGSACLRIDGAVSLAHRPLADGLARHVEVTIAFGGDTLLPSPVAGAIDRWNARNAGVRDDAKVRMTGLATGATDRVGLAITKWSQAWPTHEFLGRDDRDVAAVRTELLRLALRSGVFPTPNIATSHVVVETSDNRLLLSRRSATVAYHPLSWSASFEEGLAPEDLAPPAQAFARAAARGLVEEFGPAAVPDYAEVIDWIVELPYVNPSAVVLARTSARLDDLRPSFDELAAPPAGVPFEADALSALFWSGLPFGSERGPWHPTSRYRILAAMLRRFGLVDALSAIRRHPGSREAEVVPIETACTWPA